MTFLSKKFQKLIEREYLTFSFDGRTQEELNRSIRDLLITYERELKNASSHHVKKLGKFERLMNP